MVRCAILLAILLASATSAQEPMPVVQRGLFRAYATLCPGRLLQHPLSHINVAAGAEYMLEDRVGIRADALWYLASQRAEPIVSENSRTLVGASFHFPHGAGDLHTDFQTGIGLCQPFSEQHDGTVQPLRVVPAVSFVVGYNHYVWRYLHFFAEARYVRSRYVVPNEGALLLDEVMIAGGLGWQLSPKR